jgi:hypothetical protein
MAPPSPQIKRAVRNGVVYVLLILVFGIAVPASKGLGFFNSTLLSAYACLGTIFAGPIAANKFAVRPASFKEAVVWILKAVLFGELLAVAMLACGVATVFFSSPAFFPPDLGTIGAGLLLGLAACLALASLAAWVTVEFSPGVARMALRLIFLGLLLLFYLDGQWLPSVFGPGILISLMAAATFLMLLRNSLGKPSSAAPESETTEPGTTRQ